MAKWQRKLTKKELEHITKIAGCRTLKQFKLSREVQKEQDIECLECEFIALKLGLEG